MKSFIICINNESNPASLVVGKVYLTLPDKEAEALKMFRVLDEDLSGPDGYLYPMSMFVSIKVPAVAEQALLKTVPKKALASLAGVS